MSQSKQWKKTKEIHWKDEINDDFDEIGLSRPPVPPNYKYKRTNKINNFFSAILYHGIAVPILFVFCYLHGIRVKNRKNLKETRKTGGYIYANHVSLTDPIKFASNVCIGKRVNPIGYSDTLTIPVVKHITRACGYIPLPLKGDNDNFKAMTEALDWYVNSKHQYVLIFPEAHIWPYYTKVRTFKNGSFMYPSISLAPVIPMVTVWKRRKFRKKPRQVIIIGKPIYPDKSKTMLENKTFLYNKCLSAMQEMADSFPQQEYIRYIKEEQ